MPGTGQGDSPRESPAPYGGDARKLVTRAEAAPILGYTYGSLGTVMSRFPGKWPQPVAVRIHRRINLYRLSELLAADHVDSIALSSKVATVSDDDGLIHCQECGARMRSLVPHLIGKHAMTGDEYRDKYGLPRTAALKADMLRKSHAHAAHKRADEIAETLAPYQGREHLAELQRSGVDAIRDSTSRGVVREHRAPAQQRGVKAMHAAKQEKLEQAAHDAGYPSVEAGIIATLALSGAAAARKIGVSAQTVRRRRLALDQDSLAP